ncbi:MAG: hypothetical protein ABJE47_25755 [bacterium]
METGIILDQANSSMVMDQRWMEGGPEKSIWTGLKTKGREWHKVVTYRCGNCGYLESYAPAAEA